MKKYELLLISRTLQRLKDMNEIFIFLEELLKEPIKTKLFLTYELTLLIYNIVLNTNHDYSFFFNKDLNEQIKCLVINQLQRLYQDNLTEAGLQKIANDIEYIQKNKTYVYISDIVLYTYIFFFA